MRLRRRKVTLKLIENVADRKARYKKRLQGLQKKLKEVTTICDIEACAVSFGPGDKSPRMWPSPDVAKQLIQRFEEIPEAERSRNKVDQLSYMLEQLKKNEEKLMKKQQGNDEKEMSHFMHQIFDDGKPLSEFDSSQLKRLFFYAEEGQKNYRKIMRELIEKELPPIDPIPNPSPTPLNDLVNQADETNNIVLDNNIMVPSPLENPNDFDDMVLPQEGHDLGAPFDHGDFDGQIGLDNNNNNNIMAPTTLANDVETLTLPQERDDIGALFVAENFGNDSDNYELFPMHGNIDDNDIWPSFESAIGESDQTTVLEGNNNINGANNINQSMNTGTNGADMGIFDTKFNYQLPSDQGYFASSSEGSMPFPGNVPGGSD